MQIWIEDCAGKDILNLSMIDPTFTLDGDKLRCLSKNSLSHYPDLSTQGAVTVQLCRSEVTGIAKIYRRETTTDLEELTCLINGGHSYRRIRQKVDWLKTHWELTDQDILEFLKHAETPLDVIRRQLSSSKTITEILQSKQRGRI